MINFLYLSFHIFRILRSISINLTHHWWCISLQVKWVWINHICMSYVFLGLEWRMIKIKIRTRWNEVNANLSSLSHLIFSFRCCAKEEDLMKIKMEKFSSKKEFLWAIEFSEFFCIFKKFWIIFLKFLKDFLALIHIFEIF